MNFIANSDYEVIDRNPLSLQAGDQVRVGKRDAGWNGWVWVSVADGRGSYVPEDLLENPKAESGDETGVKAAFTAKDLSVKKGDVVEKLDEVKGWFWCRNTADVEGWLPTYLLTSE